MRTHRSMAWAIGAAAVVVSGLALVPHVAAGTIPERTTYLTFNREVRLPGVTLTRGTYIFELIDSFSSPGVVHVVSRDRKVSYFMGFTNAAERPRGMSLDASVSLGESAAGAAPPIMVWWPIGERTGREFIYPEGR